MRNVYFFILFFILFNISWGLVLIPGHEPDASWTDRPVDEIAARVGVCSGVVIHPKYVLTAKHVDVKPGTLIKIQNSDGSFKVYVAEKVFVHVDQNNPNNSQDLAIVKVRNANFKYYAKIYDYIIPVGTETVHGGWGCRIGHPIYDSYEISLSYYLYPQPPNYYEGDPNRLFGWDIYDDPGYDWERITESKGTLRYGQLLWGTNRVVYTAWEDSDLYNRQIVKFYFRNQDVHGISPTGATIYECGLALFDSGGGVFVKVDGEWSVACIAVYGTLGLKHYFQGPRTDKDINSIGTEYGAVSLYKYKEWIETTIANEENVAPEISIIF